MTILAIIQLLSALAYGVVAVSLLAAGSATIDRLALGVTIEEGATGDVQVATVTALTTVLSLASLTAGILLLRMRQLGWTITMLLTGFGLASSIINWATEGTHGSRRATLASLDVADPRLDGS